jgi:RNA polymerase sigma factor (sigma-70 family)
MSLSQPQAHRHNAALLQAYAAEQTPSRRLALRNALVNANLPLVRRVAWLESQRSAVPFDDLEQAGRLGLIKAVERFDPRRGTALSSAAMPYITGAIRQFLRDRCQPIHGSRALRELHQRGQVLQQQRQHQGRAPLSHQALCQQLGCSLERWQEALALQSALRMGSLDQPCQGTEASGDSLVDLIAAPSSDAYTAVIASDLRRLLWSVLRQLQAPQRRLLLGRVIQERSWRDLGNQLGWSAKVAQRRCEALMAQLQQQLEPALLST